jgi:topoisomerase-4 subunit A
LTCNRFDDEYLILEKWNPEQAVSCIYFDGEKGIYFIKRFLLENTTNVQTFMPTEHPKSFIEFVGTADNCTAEIVLQKIKQEKKRKMKSLILMNLSPLKASKRWEISLLKTK